MGDIDLWMVSEKKLYFTLIYILGEKNGYGWVQGYQRGKQKLHLIWQLLKSKIFNILYLEFTYCFQLIKRIIFKRKNVYFHLDLNLVESSKLILLWIFVSINTQGTILCYKKKKKKKKKMDNNNIKRNHGSYQDVYTQELLQQKVRIMQIMKLQGLFNK